MQSQNWEVEEGMTQFGGRQQEATNPMESLYQFLTSQIGIYNGNSLGNSWSCPEQEEAEWKAV